MGWLSDLFGSSEETTQTQKSKSQLLPWEPVSGALTKLGKNISAQMPNGALTGAETGALDRMGAMGGPGGVFDMVSQGFLSPTDYGGFARDAYSDLQSNLGGYASGAFLDPRSNPYFADFMTQLGARAVKAADARFAAAGRDFSGAHGEAIGRGVTEAQLPILAQMYGQNQDRQFQANSMLQGAGYGLSGLLSDLDTTRGNQQIAGLNVAGQGPAMVLDAERSRRMIPAETFGTYSGLLSDLGSRFGTQKSDSTLTRQTENSPSVMDMIGQVVGIGATLMGMPGMNTQGPGITGKGVSQMPSYLPMGGYSPYGGQNNPYSDYWRTGQVGANPFYLGAY